jgi:ssDNA thymidine ADP-ribosyltransferase, DarT
MTGIYHITHTDNLSLILEQNGLCCDNERKIRALATVGIAHNHIKERRARKRVTKSNGGTLADYVPFYFAPRSPMLYAIHTNQVQGYNGTQQNIVHICSDAEVVVQNALPYFFTDGHAEMEISESFEDLADLGRIDWSIMQAAYWHDTNEDGDRKRRRQAEFLVRQFFPWTLVTEVGVMTERIARQVTEKLQDADPIPKVVVHREWYY